MNISETIRRGNITREFPGQYDVPALYLGSGDFGGCFDETGFMNIPYQGRARYWLWSTKSKARIEPR